MTLCWRSAELDSARGCRDEAAEQLRNSYKLAISARSHQLAKNRTEAAGYSNYGERMYVEGVLKQRERVKMVCHLPPFWSGINLLQQDTQFDCLSSAIAT